MSESVRVILVRHGRTAFNATGRIQGRIDNPLDDVGRRQASAVGEALSSVLRDGAVVVHSPLLRATETARAIAAAGSAECDVMVDDGWIELDYGSFDGLHQSEIDAPTWAKWRAEPDFRPPGGESLLDVESRVSAALDRVLNLGFGTVIVVSHVSPIKAAVTLALGVDAAVAWRTRLDPASVCRLDLSATGGALHGFNDTSHLKL
jgi:broad specificity phosphatase PhoE